MCSAFRLGQRLLFATLCILTTACHKNASTSDILSGYQPPATTNESKAVLNRLDKNKFEVRVRDFDPHIELQQNPQWCWAACVEAILKAPCVLPEAKHNSVTQEQLIRMTVEHSRSQAAPADVILWAMVPELWNEYQQAETRRQQKKQHPPGNYYSFDEDHPSLPTLTALVHEISSGEPALLALRPTKNDRVGHIVIAFAVIYSKAAVDAISVHPYYIHEVKAVDPATGNEVLFDASDIEATDFAAGRVAAADYVRSSIVDMDNSKWTYHPPAPKKH